MLLGIAFFLLVSAAGFALLRLLGLSRGLLAVGLAPSAGLACLAILTTWASLAPLPSGVLAMFVAIPALGGLALIAGDVRGIARNGLRRAADRIVAALLAASVAVPALLLGLGFGGLEVPLSTIDGPGHVGVIHALRQGDSWSGTYPPGFQSITAAFLQLVPWIDSAEGAFHASLGLALLAPLAVFGLGYAIWHSRLAAAAGALVISLTALFPYDPHGWSGWALATGMLLALGLWTCGWLYLQRQSLHWIFLLALVAAGILFVHGSEVYTGLAGLIIMLVARGRGVSYGRLARDLCIGLGMVLVLTAPYLPRLVDWANAGGPGSRPFEDLGTPGIVRFGAGDNPLPFWLEALTGGSMMQLPFRALLMGIGLGWAFRKRRGGLVIMLSAVFLGIAAAFAYIEITAVEQVFVLTYPWGLKFRLAQIPAIVAALLIGAGLVQAYRLLLTLRQRWPRLFGPEHPAAWRRTAIACAMVTLFFGEGAAVTIYKTLATTAEVANTYSRDDAAAMAWLKQNARPGEVLANDGTADAGVWAPYKANVVVLASGSLTGERFVDRKLILDHIGRLESSAEASAKLCAYGVRYVYRGAKGTIQVNRSFPSLPQLGASASLEQVFASGDAAIYRIRLECAGGQETL